MRIFTRSIIILFLSGFIFSSFAASLSGNVADAETGTAISDALVWAYEIKSDSNADTSFYQTTSDKQGHYYFEFIPQGTFMITVNHPDYYDTSEKLQSVDGEIALSLNFKIERREGNYDNSISGMITDSETGDPLSYVHVFLLSPESSHRPLRAISNLNGKYVFKNIRPNTYQLMAEKNGYETFESDELLKIEEGAHIDDLDFTMVHGSSNNITILTGFVFADDGLIHFVDSVNAVASMSIVPPAVYPARVELFRVTDDDTTYYHSTWTNPDGSYRIGRIAPGDFEVLVRARGYFAHKEFISIKQGYNEKVFFLKPKPDLYGVIGGNVVFDDSQAPVSGALISFINLTDRSHFAHTYTNQDGDYKARLKPGQYVVSCSYLGYKIWDVLTVENNMSNKDTMDLFRPYWCGYYSEYFDDTQSFAEAERIPVYDGSEISGIDFGIPDYLAIEKFMVSGTVLDEDGSPVADAEVRIYVNNCLNYFAADVWGSTANWNPSPDWRNSIPDRYYTTKTNDDGTYSLSIDNSFWYSTYIIVSAHHEGFQPQFYDHKNAFYEADRIRVTETEITGIDFDLVPEPVSDFSMGGLITNPEKDPIPGAFIITGNALTGQLYFTMSNGDGFYSFNGLPQGVYYTLFIAFHYGPELWDDATHWADADPITLDQDLLDINAELQPVIPDTGNCILTGRIRSLRGLAISGALITVWNKNKNIVGYTFTDANGDYNIAGLAEGEYNIEVGKVAYTTASTNVWVTSDYHATVVLDMEINNSAVTSSGSDGESKIPDNMFLGDNYPNPFNPSTTVNFGLKDPARVNLAVYNILGQRVKVLLNSYLPAGSYSATWDGLDSNGQSVSSGLYFMLLETGQKRIMKKMVLTK